jgi:cytochrome d ubiquinol oxidase subunit I
VPIGLPDPATESNKYKIKIPVLGSIIGSMSLTSKEVGLTDFPPQDRPPVPSPQRLLAVLYGLADVRFGLRHARALVLALLIQE